MKLTLTIFALIFTMSFAALAAETKAAATPADQSIELENTLIEKFTNVYLKLAPNDPAKSGVTLRLADLLSERARKNSIDDLLKGQKDRNQAIRYYKEAVAAAPDTSKARIWIQIGHLFELNGDTKSAVQAYTQVLSMPVATGEQIADANLSLGEVSFKQRNFEAARGYFTKVVDNPKAVSRGFAMYRIAWTAFNLGQIDRGIEGLVQILKNPDLLRRSAAVTGGVDTQFQEEVSRDLATFMAKRRVQEKDLSLIYELSPENAKLANITYLAGEAERLGQTQEALTLWKFVNGKQSNPRDRLESTIHMAQLEVARQQFEPAVQNYENALQLWSALGSCNDDACKELKTRLKNIVVEWNKSQKKNPSAELQKAYQAYHRAFPEDVAMTLYLAQVARERKDYETAFQTFSETGNQAGENQEAALLSAIETAEMAKKPEWLKSAYAAYLAKSVKRERVNEVEYQSAKLIYDQGDYAAASEALHNFALNSKTPAGANAAAVKANLQLRDQAANLALDALGILKDDAKIQTWSAEFAKAMPGSASEKREVARKAMMNQVARESTAGNLEQAWALMQKDSFRDAPASDRALYLKNKLVLAEKMKKYSDARNIADDLIALPGVKAEDRDYALARKAWLSELVLDFDSALAATQKLPSKKEDDKRLLKLAMYADLAAKETKPFYTEYLKVSHDDQNRIAIASQLVKSSPQPLKELETYKGILGKSPEVLAKLYLEIYGKNRSPEVLKKALAQPGVLKTPSGPVLRRQQFLADYKQLKAQLESQKVDASTQRKMANSLKSRIALLDKSEKTANAVIATGDWTSQVLYLDLIGKERERFYQEIMALPLPPGLTPEQEQEYLQALSQQAAPHQVKGQDLAKKVKEFWADEKAVGQLVESLDQATAEVRPLIENEISILSTVAPETAKAQLAEALKPKNAVVAEKPNLQIIETARAAVRGNPMDRQAIANLLEVEQKWGRTSMVSYLKGRLETLGSETPAEPKEMQK